MGIDKKNCASNDACNEEMDDKAAAAEEVATCNSNGMNEKKALQTLIDQNADEDKKGEADSYLAAVDASGGCEKKAGEMAASKK